MKRIVSVLVVAIMLVSLLCACSNSLKAIRFSESDIQITVGDSKMLELTTEPQDFVLKKLTWSTSNSNIVTVEQGMVRALASGNAVVSVKTEQGATASCAITVVDKEITDISLNKSTVKIKVDATTQLEAKVTPADAPTGGLKWSSSDSDVATVNSEGFVTGIKAGVVNIKCESANGIEASCTVTVEKDGSSSNKDSQQTVIQNFYGYGHYHPDYVYSASDFVFPESSYRKLTNSEISATLAYMGGYSPSGSYAQDAINEIYARNGYVFKTAEIRAYYESKPWYYADPNFTISRLTSIEKYNVDLLTKY